MSMDSQQNWGPWRDATREVYSSEEITSHLTHVRALQYTYLVEQRKKENI